MVLGLKEGLVECATVCVKIVVILNVAAILRANVELVSLLQKTGDAHAPLEFPGPLVLDVLHSDIDSKTIVYILPHP